MSIQLKTIGELKEHHFVVPSYQRGYRWTKLEVEALLDDIAEFSSEGGKKYCIQPLIIQKRQDGSYEVVDGQQRLTTIYIFMKIAEQEIRSATPPFELRYDTREESAAFLRGLSDATCSNDSNIDFYHMGKAYQTMLQWLDRQEDKSVAVSEMNVKIRRSVFFIWYELLPDSHPIAVFTKVNLGKIPLTNAELIKALLLNKDNFISEKKTSAEIPDIEKRQIEISIAWDRIEHGLHNDSFWYFLSEKEHSETRIDLLFGLLAEEYDKEYDLFKEYKEGQESFQIKKQEFFPFYVFSRMLEQKEKGQEQMDFINTLWNKVERLYEEFCGWYEDLNKYHVIGYLIAAGVSISEIRALTWKKRKSAVGKALLEKAKIDYKDLESISLESSWSKTKIRKILLLHNIATLVCKSEKQYRFPFDLYKKGKWDIEHIHATADETDEPDDQLGNLTLLDYQTNRSYKNCPFPEKRQILLERESKGLFVPLCTRNVFTKAYSKDLQNMDLWNETDKADYIASMKQTLDTFFEGGVTI